MIATPVSLVAAIINALVVLACVVYFGWRGYRHGVLRTLQRLISTVSGYAACYFLTDKLASLLTAVLGLTVMMSYLLSATLLLVAVIYIVNALLSRYIAGPEAEKAEAALGFEPDDSNENPPGDKAGLAVGVLLGCFLGLLTVWFAGITVDAVALNTQGPAALVARTADPVRKMAGEMVGAAVGYAVEHKTGQQSLAPDLTARLVADPVVTSQQIAEVSKSEELKRFFSDPEVRLLMQQNKVDELQSHPAFQKLVSAPQTRLFLDVLGSTVKNAGELTTEARAAQLLVDMYQKARAVQSDPRFIALSQKPEFQELLRNPSPAALLSNPMVKELGDIVFSDTAPTKLIGNDVIIVEGSDQSFEALPKPQWQSLAETEATPERVVADDESVPVDEGNVIYRWTDEHGQRHFSQTKPEGDYPLEIIKNP